MVLTGAVTIVEPLAVKHGMEVARQHCMLVVEAQQLVSAQCRLSVHSVLVQATGLEADLHMALQFLSLIENRSLLVLC